MLIATLVKCLSDYTFIYISFRCHCCRSVHVWILRILLDIDRWSKVGTRYKEHRYACRTCDLRKEGGWPDSVGIRKVREDCRDWMTSSVRRLRFYWIEKCLFLGILRSNYCFCYWFHDPEYFWVVLGAFEFFVKNDIFTRQLIRRWQEIILIWFFAILFI